MTETKTEEYKKGYREGFLDGFHAARDNESLMSPNIPTGKFATATLNCHKCGIRLDNAMGYVCPDNNCPTQFKVTC